MNAILHTVESVDRRTVETATQLQEALKEMLGEEDVQLINTYVVTLYEETLSDGSKTASIGIRIAEALP